jgi:hypothetical protein
VSGGKRASFAVKPRTGRQIGGGGGAPKKRGSEQAGVSVAPPGLVGIWDAIPTAYAVGYKSTALTGRRNNTVRCIATPHDPKNTPCKLKPALSFCKVSKTGPAGDFGLVPVEIKHGQTVDPRKLGSLKDFIRQYRCRFGLVINNDTTPRRYDTNIVGLPFNHL